MFSITSSAISLSFRFGGIARELESVFERLADYAVRSNLAGQAVPLAEVNAGAEDRDFCFAAIAILNKPHALADKILSAAAPNAAFAGRDYIYFCRQLNFNAK